jgi:hypothetical protein
VVVEVEAGFLAGGVSVEAAAAFPSEVGEADAGVVASPACSASAFAAGVTAFSVEGGTVLDGPLEGSIGALSPARWKLVANSAARTGSSASRITASIAASLVSEGGADIKTSTT